MATYTNVSFTDSSFIFYLMQCQERMNTEVCICESTEPFKRTQLTPVLLGW